MQAYDDQAQQLAIKLDGLKAYFKTAIGSNAGIRAVTDGHAASLSRDGEGFKFYSIYGYTQTHLSYLLDENLRPKIGSLKLNSRASAEEVSLQEVIRDLEGIKNSDPEDLRIV